ncbi:MAG: STAS domain-containing protein [Planctomycetota bacterium]|jgi:anti-anti-sigma factor
MGMTWEDRPDARRIILSGELDHEGCARVHDELQQVAEDSADRVIVDFSDVPFVASNGLRLLLETHHQLRDAGRRLLVHNLQPAVHRVFATTGIFDAIPEFET